MQHRSTWRAVAMAAVVGVLGAGLAGPASAGTIAFDAAGLQAPDTVTVSIPGVAPGGLLPTNYTADGRNISPAATWTEGPAGTRGYVLVMQDPDAPGATAAVHWLVYAIPPGLTALPRGMKNMAEPKTPLGVRQGANDHGSVGYSGPRPPLDEPAHHYHLQVFALDTALRTRPGADLTAVARAMAGHVLARGELVAAYTPAAPKTHPPRTGAAPAGPPAPAATGPAPAGGRD